MTTDCATYTNRNVAKEITLAQSKKEKEPFKLWESTHIDIFIKAADKLGYWNAGTAVLLAFETGQRQTDIFNFQEPRDYKNGRLSFVQSKTGQEISIPATEKLQKRLRKKPKEQLLLTVNDYSKQKWTHFSFNKVFRKICAEADLEGYVFRKIRNSLTVLGERAGMTDDEFHSIFGWSRNTVKSMKDNHYGSAHQEIADRAISKIETFRSEKS